MNAAVKQSVVAVLVLRWSHFACGARLGHSAKSEVTRLGDSFKSEANASEGVMGCNGLFDLIFVGDFGGRNDQQKKVAAGMAIMAGRHNPPAIIGTGDNIYPDGAEGSNALMKEWWRDIYMQHGTLQRPWYSVTGNHDWYSDGRQQYNFTQADGNTGGHWKMTYLYYYKGYIASGVQVDLFFIDTMVWRKSSRVSEYMDVNTEYENQKNWLISSLYYSRAEWKIVVGHHPIYSAGYHGITYELLDELDPILRTYRANMYICGHDHSTQLISYQGMNYIVSGAGSQSPRNKKNEQPPGSLLKYEETGGFVRLRFCSATKAELKFHDQDGTFQDPSWDIPNQYLARASVGSKDASQEEDLRKWFNMSSARSECEGVVLKDVDKSCSTDGCTVLPDRPSSQTCEQYCSDHGLACIEAWTQDGESCQPAAQLGCEGVARETMDNLMCRCGNRG